MKKKYMLFLTLSLGISTAQIINFPDDGYRRIPQATANTPVYIPNSGENTYNEQDPESIVIRGVNEFILDINRVVPTSSPYLENANNIVYGPLTIAGALTVVLLASVGQTFNEIAYALGFSSGLDIENNPFGVHEYIGRLGLKLSRNTGTSVGEQVNYAVAIFVQNDYPIRPAFQRASKEFYGGDIINVDFRQNAVMAQNVINTWVSNRTNSKIPTLLNDFPPPNTKAIVVGVLYFKAAWEFPFFEGHTKWRPFFVNGRKNPSDRMVQMMSNGGEFPYHKDRRLGVEIMGFPYKGNHSTMYVIMPLQSDTEKLKRLENSLTAADIDYLINSTKYTEAVVLFPKMKLENTINLKPALQTLGINALFNPYQANLALLSSGTTQRFNSEEAPFVSPPLTTVPSVVQRPRQTPPPQRPQSTPRTEPPQRPQPTPRPQPPPRQQPVQRPEPVDDRLIFTRFSSQSNCIPVFNLATNTTVCRNIVVNQQNNRAKRATANRFAEQNIPSLEALDNIRREISSNLEFANPGIWADEVIHKVYMDITESGTEAAAATAISLNRSGGRVTFRVDIPFLFFIYHENTKIILFWGSVKSPSPSIATPST